MFCDENSETLTSLVDYPLSRNVWFQPHYSPLTSTLCLVVRVKHNPCELSSFSSCRKSLPVENSLVGSGFKNFVVTTVQGNIDHSRYEGYSNMDFCETIYSFLYLHGKWPMFYAFSTSSYVHILPLSGYFSLCMLWSSRIQFRLGKCEPLQVLASDMHYLWTSLKP